MRLRLMRVTGTQRTKKGSRSYDVWLLASVLSRRQLSVSQAGQWYRWRWENEGFFRTYKRTLKKATLMGRTVAQVHRDGPAAGTGCRAAMDAERFLEEQAH